MESRESSAPTVCTTPCTGGMRRRCPGRMMLSSSSPFDHITLQAPTLKRAPMPHRLSPARTVYEATSRRGWEGVRVVAENGGRSRESRTATSAARGPRSSRASAVRAPASVLKGTSMPPSGRANPPAPMARTTRASTAAWGPKRGRAARQPIRKGARVASLPMARAEARARLQTPARGCTQPGRTRTALADVTGARRSARGGRSRVVVVADGVSGDGWGVSAGGLGERRMATAKARFSLRVYWCGRCGPDAGWSIVPGVILELRSRCSAQVFPPPAPVTAGRPRAGENITRPASGLSRVPPGGPTRGAGPRCGPGAPGAGRPPAPGWGGAAGIPARRGRCRGHRTRPGCPA